jgi:type IX secretion system PorP/SprF family membrane protein
MKKIIYIISLVGITSASVYAQDYSLSQPFESPVLLNPANAGLTFPVRTNLNYRQQWRSISKPFTTFIASADAKILSQGKTGSSLGLGIVLASDQAGTSKLNTLNANLALMGKVMLNEMNTLSAGIIGGLMQRKVGGDLTWTDQFDGSQYNQNYGTAEVFDTQKRMAPDIGAGIQWSYGKGAATLSSNDAIGAQLGFAAYHVNMPNTGFQEDADKRYIRMVLHGSFSYGIKNTPIQLNPCGIVQMQGPSRMYYGGMYFKYRLQESSKYTGNLSSRSLNLGSFYRVGDAFIASLQFEWDMLAVGISYDLNLSSLTKASNGRGGTEISLRYLPFKPKKANSLL